MRGFVIRSGLTPDTPRFPQNKPHTALSRPNRHAYGVRGLVALRMAYIGLDRKLPSAVK